MTENDKALKDCERMIQKSLKSPIVKFLREHLDKSGCPVQDNFFKAINCDKLQASGYIPGEGIAVCGNRTQMQDEVTQAITHELIHAFDDCRAANLDWTDCAHHACSEIRAGHLSGDCHFKRELLRGFMTVRGHEQEGFKERWSYGFKTSSGPLHSTLIAESLPTWSNLTPSSIESGTGRDIEILDN